MCQAGSLPLGLPVPRERKLPQTVQSLDIATRARGQLPCSQREPGIKGPALDWEPSSWCPPGLPRGLRTGTGQVAEDREAVRRGRDRAVTKGTKGHCRHWEGKASTAPEGRGAGPSSCAETHLWPVAVTAWGHLGSRGHLSHYSLQEPLSYKPQNQNGKTTHLGVQKACLPGGLPPSPPPGPGRYPQALVPV